MFEIRIDPGQETGSCRCTTGSCPYAEQVTGHHRVLLMQYHAAQHAAVLGHRVTEDVGWHKVVMPRSTTDY